MSRKKRKYYNNRQLSFNFNTTENETFSNIGGGKDPSIIERRLKELKSLNPITTKINIVFQGEDMVYIGDRDLNEILDENIKSINGYITVLSTQMKLFGEGRGFTYYQTASKILRFLIDKVFKEFMFNNININQMYVDHGRGIIENPGQYLVGILFFLKKQSEDVKLQKDTKAKIRILYKTLKNLHGKRFELSRMRKKITNQANKSFDLSDMDFFTKYDPPQLTPE